MANRDPEKAIRNADNYPLFLESQFLHWEGDQCIVLNPESNYAPGMVTFHDSIYCFYKGKNSNTLYFLTYNGASWKKNEKIKDQPGVSFSPGTNTTPSPVVFHNCIYLFYKGDSSVSPHSFYCSKIAAASNNKITPKSNQAPSAAVLGNKIYVVYKSDSNNDLFYLTFDGTNWEGDRRISSVADFAPKSDKAPTVSTIDNILYITYKGESSNELYQAYYNCGVGLEDGIWYGNQTVSSKSTIHPLTNQPHGVVSLGNYNYCIYKGQKSDQLYFMYQSK